MRIGLDTDHHDDITEILLKMKLNKYPYCNPMTRNKIETFINCMYTSGSKLYTQKNCALN